MEGLTGVDLRLEGRSNLVDAGAKAERALAVLLQLFFVRAQVGQMQLAFRHFHQATHVGSKLLFECREVDVAIAIRVEHMFHQQCDVGLGCLDLVLEQVCLEVFVGDEAVPVGVERTENLEGSWLA